MKKMNKAIIIFIGVIVLFLLYNIFIINSFYNFGYTRGWDIGFHGTVPPSGEYIPFCVKGDYNMSSYHAKGLTLCTFNPPLTLLKNNSYVLSVGECKLFKEVF